MKVEVKCEVEGEREKPIFPDERSDISRDRLENYVMKILRSMDKEDLPASIDALFYVQQKRPFLCCDPLQISREDEEVLQNLWDSMAKKRNRTLKNGTDKSRIRECKECGWCESIPISDNSDTGLKWTLRAHEFGCPSCRARYRAELDRRKHEAGVTLKTAIEQHVRREALDEEKIRKIAISDVELLRKKGAAYGDSWKKRGGVGAYVNLARKMDRLDNQAKQHDYDIFKAAMADKDGLGVIDDLIDMSCYLLLIRAEIEELKNNSGETL